MYLFVFAKNYVVLAEVLLEALFPLGECSVLFRPDFMGSLLFEFLRCQLKNKLLELLETAQSILIFVYVRLNLLNFDFKAF